MNLVKKWFLRPSWDWSIACDVSGQKLEQEISYMYEYVRQSSSTPTVKLDHQNSWQWALYSLVGESYKSDRHTRRWQKSKQWHRLSPTVEASVINVVCVCELFTGIGNLLQCIRIMYSMIQINVKACWITYVAALGCYFVLYMCVLSLLRTFLVNYNIEG